MKPQTALIIDDEPLVREDLHFMLQDHPEINLVGEAASIDEATELLSRTSPDLVFLDVQLRGGSGFDLVPYISPNSAIIFFTAYDEYAVRAFEVNALDYLLKPVSSDRLALAIKKFNSYQKGQAISEMGALSLQMDDQVFVQTDQDQRFISVQEISTITYEGGNYSLLTMRDGQTYMVRRNLKHWEEQLPEHLFIRVHRSALVNLLAIESFLTQSNGCSILSMTGKTDTVVVSRRLTPQLKALIKHPKLSIHSPS